MSRVIEVREILQFWLARLQQDNPQAVLDALVKDLDKVIPMLRRRPRVRQAPASSNKVTREMKARIRNLAEATDMTQAQIAGEMNVSPGRVSEVLNGLR